MGKVWILTVVFFSSGGGTSVDTQQYEYHTQQSCQVWQKFWRKQWMVGNAVCSQVDRVK